MLETMFFTLFLQCPEYLNTKLIWMQKSILFLQKTSSPSPYFIFNLKIENSALKQVLEQYVPSQQEDEPGSHLLFNKRVVCQWIFGS